MSFSVTTEPLDTAALARQCHDAHSGGYVSFEGWVRNHHEGKPVKALSYQIYPQLALTEGNRVIAEALEKFAIDHAFCQHRHGDLGIGDCAVWVGVSAAHRKEAFAACQYIIDNIKHRVPIWKHEHYTDGTSAWVGCHGCQNPDHDHTHEHHHGHSHSH